MIIRHATNQDVGYVLGHLREFCRRELLATRPAAEDIVDLGREMDRFKPHLICRYALSPKGARVPAAIFQAYRGSPVLAAFQTFSTAAWPAVARPFIPFFNKVAAPALRRAGIERAEFGCLLSSEFEPRWYALMGAYPQGAPQPLGRAGELYQPMLWLSDPATVDAAAVDAASAALGSRSRSPG